MSRKRSIILFIGKAAFAALLIGWLVRSGSLDFKALSLFLERPLLLLANLGLFSAGLFFGALRWSYLLRLVDVHMPLGRALQLQLTALFFNTVIPGNVGGDVIKSVYAAREAAPAKRPTVFLIVFVERLLGLAALVLVAFVVTIARGPVVWQNPQLRALASAVVFLAAATIVMPALLVFIVRTQGDRLATWTGGTTRIAKLLSQLVAAARLVSAGPKNLAVALLLSMIPHLVSMLVFATLATAITRQDVSLATTASIFPLGILTLIVPVSPAGLGVGHVAFDRLFAMVGLTGGATVFNVFLIGQITPCLFGVLPYLALKRGKGLPTAAEAAAHQTGTATTDRTR